MNMTEEKKLLYKTSCERCGSSDALQVYEKKDGKKDGYCFSCSSYYNTIGDKTINTNHNKNKGTKRIPPEIHELPSLALPDRKIRQETVEYYGVKCGFSSTHAGKINSHFYPIYNKNRELIAYKERVVDTKELWHKGDPKGGILFGRNVCPMGKKVFITEGELDAMALHQALRDTNSSKFKDFIPSVVSISHGASVAVTQLVQEADWLNKFQEVVLVFDNDEAGMKAAEDVAKILEHDKILIARLDLNDPCDMVREGRERELRHAVLIEAQPYEPDGIVNAKDAWDRYKNRNTAKSYPYPPAFEGLNEKTYGWRMGSVVTITSGTGSGKTQFLRELNYHILKTTDFKIAAIALEEDVGDTLEGLMALELNKRIGLPDVTTTEREEHTAFDTLFKDGRLELYDHFGGMNDESLFSRIRYFAKYLGCRVFTLDHLSIIISETADEGDERRRIDSMMTKLAVLAKSLDIVIFLVVHLKKAAQGKSFEEGHVATADDLRGSASIKQLSFDILTIARNQQELSDDIRNTSSVHVLKCRYSGRTGLAGYVKFNGITGRMEKTGDPHEVGAEFINEEKMAF